MFGSGRLLWLVTGYEEVRATLSVDALSADYSHPDFPPIFRLQQSRRPDGSPPTLGYSAMDGDTHTLHRRRVAREFTPAAITLWRGRIEREAVALVRDFAAQGSPADFVTGFAQPFVARVNAAFLGLNLAQAEACARLSRIILGTGEDPARVIAAGRAMRLLVSRAIDNRTRTPPKDLLGRMIERYRAEGAYDQDQVVALAASLITAGLETSVNTIVLGLYMLLSDRDVLEQIKIRPARMAVAAEEIVRLTAVADIVTARVATIPCEIGGMRIAAGDGVVASTAAANRDPSRFSYPDRIDLDRAPRGHLAFGHGRHKCLGQHLARLMVEAGLGTLLRRLDGLRPATSESATAWSGGVMVGLSRFHVEWDRTRL
jgi:cytochrome P450